MDPALPDGHPGPVERLHAYVREHLGMDAQAITRFGRPGRVARAPVVWHVVTVAGTLWLVERDGVAELFLATPLAGASRSVARYRFAGQAARRFLELHP